MPSIAKSRVRFTCNQCGVAHPKWEGRCNGCGAWNTLVEEVERSAASRQRLNAGTSGVPTLLDQVDQGDIACRSTSMVEVDRVLGGGLVDGGLLLLGGDPGIGKSTLALQLAEASGSAISPTLYCAGEESAGQLALRASRLGCNLKAIEVLAETDLDTLVATIITRHPQLAIVDSVQTVYDPSTPGTPGSPSQVREAVGRLMVAAKSSGVTIILIGHVTKEGAIAGPRTLEHMVDVVLYLEGERHGEHRLLRGIKNRFGPSGELGLLVMTETGMQQLDSASRAFLDEGSLGVAGNALTVVCEGSRALAVEVQALTATTSFGLPRRTTSGFDIGRLHLLLAVLEKRGRVPLGQKDVYVNAVGGVRLSEPSSDLAVALAIASASKDLPLPADCLVLGELGLGGEVRRVRRLEARLQEAATLGLTQAVIPSGQTVDAPRGMHLRAVASLAEALRLLK